MISLDAGWMLTALLLSIRFGAIALMAPPMGAGLVPVPVRFAIVLALAAALTPGSVAPVVIASGALPALLLAALREAGLGAAMAIGINLAFATFGAGARLLDIQIGFGMGQVLDPLTRQRQPVVSAAVSQLALVAFFLLGAHHGLLRGLAMSIEHVPPGSSWAIEAVAQSLVRQASELFSLGFAMVAPIVVCLLLVELGLGMLSRNLPQLNTLVLGMPVKIVVGLVTLSAWLGASSGVMSRIYAGAFASWEAMWA